MIFEWTSEVDDPDMPSQRRDSRVSHGVIGSGDINSVVHAHNSPPHVDSRVLYAEKSRHLLARGLSRQAERVGPLPVARGDGSTGRCAKKLGRSPYVVEGYLTRPDEAITKLGPIDDPMIGVFVHWTYAPAYG